MDIRETVASSRPNLIIRLVVATILVLSISYVGSAYLNRHETVDGPTANTSFGDPIAGESNGTTVITTQGKIPTVEIPRAAISEPNGAIYAINPSGGLIYKNTTYHVYWDVDPVPGTRASALYVAAELVPAEDCGTNSPCYSQHVQRVNVSTGEITAVYSDVTPSGRWHDVDRYDEDSLLVADISSDRVEIVNTTSGLVEWSWQAETALPPSSGGDFGGDWTHINDVELLPDGRIMVDLRNQDVVMFIDPDTGVQRRWTLGEDDAHDILYEQHNPDYIPHSRGGPAVPVADSKNDRIVEYQRVDGQWQRSWVWQDARMDWPRDADRLPSGNTLITDSGADRVVEINESGEIVWSVTVDFPYEAERIGTGDESRGGASADRLGLTSRTAAADEGETNATTKSGLIPDDVRNAISFVTPVWMGPSHLGAVAIILSILVGWPLVEFYWSPYELTIRRPVLLERP